MGCLNEKGNSSDLSEGGNISSKLKGVLSIRNNIFDGLSHP